MGRRLVPLRMARQQERRLPVQAPFVQIHAVVKGMLCPKRPARQALHSCPADNRCLHSNSAIARPRLALCGRGLCFTIVVLVVGFLEAEAHHIGDTVNLCDVRSARRFGVNN